MGGAAFTQAAAPGEPTLHTPRMSPAEYAHLKSTYLARLRNYFPGKTVSVLLEAPEKTDYGDIDFIVSSDARVDTVDLARKVGATGVICNSSGKHQRCSLGVPKDGSRSSKETVVYRNVASNNPKKSQPSSNLTVEQYAQIDIEVIATEEFHWHVFYCSYGDLGGLLGNIVRNLGFTVSDKGLILRLKELDDAKALKIGQIADKDGMLCLSDDPDLILRFLGMSPERYAKGFTTVESFYEWIAECRLISMRLIRKKRNISRDRQREAKRNLYTTFFEEWLPRRYGRDDDEPDRDDQDKTPKDDQISAEDSKPLDREALRDEAVAYFDKTFEFSRMHTTLRLSICNLMAERLLKPIIAEHSGLKDKKLTEVVRAFRRWVGFDQTKGQPYILETPRTDADSQLYGFLKGQDDLELHDPQRTDRWIKEHWEGLKMRERQRVKVARGKGCG